MAFAQTSVTGKVTSSEDGEPVVGASIKIVGTNTGTVTDIDGNFVLNAPADAKLEFPTSVCSQKLSKQVQRCRLF